MPFLKMLFPVILLTIISCDTTQKVPATMEPVFKRLNILLKEGIQPEKVEANFTKYKLTKGKRASFTENRWIFTFDANLISTEDIIKEIKSRPAIIEAKAIN